MKFMTESLFVYISHLSTITQGLNHLIVRNQVRKCIMVEYFPVLNNVKTIYDELQPGIYCLIKHYRMNTKMTRFKKEFIKSCLIETS